MSTLNSSGWYNASWRYRVPISLDCTAGGGGPYDVSWTVPKDFNDFWQNVLSTGFDMVLTEWDGITEIVNGAGQATAWDRGVGFNKTTKTCTVRIDGLTVGSTNPITDSQHNLVWLYFGASSTVAPSSHTFGVVALGATVTSRSSILDPRKVTPKFFTRPEAPGALVASRSFQMASTETTFLFVDFEAELLARLGTYENHPNGDGLRSVTVSSEKAGVGSAVVSTTNVAFVDHKVIRIRCSGGTSGDSHTVKIKAVTASDRTLDRRFILKFQDVDES